MTGPGRRQELLGEVALITGGARGIGAAAGLALADGGATVCLADVLPCDSAVAAVKDAGGRAQGYRLDVRDRDGCRRLVDAVFAQHGRLDMLVCNAGIAPAGTVAGNWEQWQRVLDVNLNGTQNCVAAVWDRMAAGGGGRIVIVSSMSYYRGGVIVGTEYSASKAALIGITRHLARNGGPLGIRCNAVAPGIIDNEQTAGFAKPDLDTIPLGRLGTSTEVAGPIRFLCGPDSSYMTGAVLNVTGGIVLSA